jgi:hypothetical protein
VEIGGVNGPLMSFLAQLTRSHGSRRGEVDRGERRFVYPGIPDVVIGDSFNYVAFVDPDVFNEGIEEVLRDHTQVFLLERHPSASQESEGGKGELIELARRRRFKQANEIASKRSVGNEALAEYGLELSKLGWRPERGGTFAGETLDLASDVDFWRACELTAAVSRPLRRWLLELLNTPEILESTYATIRERCLFALRHACLDQNEYGLLKRYSQGEPIEDVGILALDIRCKDPGNEKVRETERRQQIERFFGG